MRLKTFNAQSMSDALALVKEHFGADAIIVSTQSNLNSGVRVTAAIDGDPAPQEVVNPGKENGRDPLDVISEALNHHNVPVVLADNLLEAAAANASADPVVAMTTALDSVFRFATSPLSSARQPVSLVGIPGAGKTVAVAKLATEAVVGGQPAVVITTDTIRAGGVEQLAAFTDILKIELVLAKEPARLSDALTAAGPKRPILVDHAGANPFDPVEFNRQESFCAALNSPSYLVMAAGTDSGEAAEIADAFKDLGVRGLIATRLDIARRIGAILTAAAVGDFELLAITANASVAEPPQSLTAVALARILLPDSHIRDVSSAPAPLWQSQRPA